MTVGAGAAAFAMPGALWAALSGLNDDEIERRVQELLAQMTLHEKIEQMSGWLFRDFWQALGPKGKRYTGYTPANRRLGIPALKCVDGPRGVGLFYKTTCFPVGVARGASWDRGLEERVGQVMGYEAAALGMNMLLAPCINVVRHPSWGRAQESYGEDPCHLGRMGGGHVIGTQQHVMACAKHYAVNHLDQSRMFVNMIVDERTLREIYLPHFQACVAEGVASIMSAYNDVNGLLCGHNPHLLRDILKGEWGFQGFVVSDWINAVEDTTAAANAGLDVEMPRPEYFGRKLERAVKKGRVAMEVINEAAGRVIRQKLRFAGEAKCDPARIAGPEHAALAREACAKGIVLLKNQGRVLPLDPARLKTLAVIGEFADQKNIGDVGSSMVTPPYVITPLAGTKERLGSAVTVIHAEGKDLEAARQAAAQADVAVVVVGLSSRDEGEGNDREDLNLPAEQEKLIQTVAQANPQCVVVLEGGGAITMQAWIDQVPAVLMAWYPGMEGGRGIADVLFGDVNPSGKLPVVFPQSLDQLFPFDNQAKTVECGYYHGYRYFDKQGLEPAFPFGFGLSYTTYQYSNLRLDQKTIGNSGKLTMQVDVTNTGERAGEEVVQLYVGYHGSKVDRSVKELKGFGRVALQPGETKTVTLELLARDLAYYDVDKKAWVVEEIEYLVSVGPSSRAEDLQLHETFRIAGA